jgi:hypothetical protein
MKTFLFIVVKLKIIFKTIVYISMLYKLIFMRHKKRSFIYAYYIETSLNGFVTQRYSALITFKPLYLLEIYLLYNILTS